MESLVFKSLVLGLVIGYLAYALLQLAFGRLRMAFLPVSLLTPIWYNEYIASWMLLGIAIGHIVSVLLFYFSSRRRHRSDNSIII